MSKVSKQEVGCATSRAVWVRPNLFHKKKCWPTKQVFSISPKSLKADKPFGTNCGGCPSNKWPQRSEVNIEKWPRNLSKLKTHDFIKRKPRILSYVLKHMFKEWIIALAREHGFCYFVIVVRTIWFYIAKNGPISSLPRPFVSKSII